MKVPQRPIQTVFPCQILRVEITSEQEAPRRPVGCCRTCRRHCCKLVQSRSSGPPRVRAGERQQRFAHLFGCVDMVGVWPPSSARGGDTPSRVRLRRARADTHCEALEGCSWAPNNADSARARGQGLTEPIRAECAIRRSMNPPPGRTAHSSRSTVERFPSRSRDRFSSGP